MRSHARDHQRAFELACDAFSGVVLDGRQQMWLETHLDACPECREQVEEARAAVAALKSVSIVAGRDLVQGTQRRVRTQGELRRARRMRPIWISSAFACVWMACTTPYLWQYFDWTGHWLHIPDLLWQMAFLVAWFTPALTGAAVALWLRPEKVRVVPGREWMRAAA